MTDYEEKYSFLRKNIQSENKSSKREPFKAFEIQGKILQNLKLLKSLIQSEKVQQNFFDQEDYSKLNLEKNGVKKIQNKIVDELVECKDEDLARFSIPKKYYDECYELLISAWRRKVNQKYSQTLTFTEFTFNLESFRAFIVAISLNVTLKALRLEACKLKEKEMKLLGVFIKIHPTIQILHLDNNPIKDEGLELILAALKFNDQLLHLSLVNTFITNISAKRLSETISQRPLKSLNLEKNKFNQDSLGILITACTAAGCELLYDLADD